MKIFVIVLKVLLLVAPIGCSTKPTVSKELTSAEVRAFMDDIAHRLVNDMESVGNLYYDSGVVFSGHGNHLFFPIDSVKLMYRERPKTMDYFVWSDVWVEPIGENTALVTSLFHQHLKDEPDTTRFAYTGLLVKTKSGWKIKHEHESKSCRKK